MKKLLIASLCFLFLTGCTSSVEERVFNEPNSEVKEPHPLVTGEASVIAGKVLEQKFNLANFEVKVTDNTCKVFHMPDDKNAQTGEVYLNLYNVLGTFTYQDKIYDFTMLYSMKNKSDYSVVYFSTPYDESIIIDTKLESEQ